MSTAQQIREYIRACEHMIKFFNKMLSRGEYAQGAEDRLAELTELRLQARSDSWPPALDDKETANDRMRSFLGSISVPIKSQKVLEFGSCDTTLATLLKSECGAAKVYSYDVELCKYNERTVGDPAIVFTDNFRLVQHNGIYDIVVINDIIDHLEKPVYWLKQLADLINPQSGRVFARCHPYTSKNGTHLGEQINKAFLHLVFSDDELATLGITNRYTRKILDLNSSYQRFFEEAGLKVVREEIKKCPVDSIFLTDSRITSRIKKNLDIQDNIINFLEVEYIDYELMR